MTLNSPMLEVIRLLWSCICCCDCHSVQKPVDVSMRQQTQSRQNNPLSHYDDENDPNSCVIRLWIDGVVIPPTGDLAMVIVFQDEVRTGDVYISEWFNEIVIPPLEGTVDLDVVGCYPLHCYQMHESV